MLIFLERARRRPRRPARHRRPAAKGAVIDALRRHEATHPEDRGRFQVIAMHELEVA